MHVHAACKMLNSLLLGEKGWGGIERLSTPKPSQELMKTVAICFPRTPQASPGAGRGTTEYLSVGQALGSQGGCYLAHREVVSL